MTEQHVADISSKNRAPLTFAEDGRPEILLSDEWLSDTIDEAQEALRLRKANVYQQNGRLVQLVRHNAGNAETREKADSCSQAIRRPAGAILIQDIESFRLLELLASSAHWFKFDGRAKGSNSQSEEPGKKGSWRKAKVPMDIARHIESRPEWNLPVIKGCIEAPTLRTDGSILQQAGYDLESQLCYEPSGTVFPVIADQPTRKDAVASLVTLKTVIRDFPFVPNEEGDWGGASSNRSVALSCMLTGLVRRSLATAPAHAVSAPTPGTGKTKIAEIAAALATGRTPTAISYGKTQEEFEKRLFSVLLTGDPVIIIDNVEADAVASDEFCTILTSEVIKNRILGASQMATVPTTSLFVLNGNNLRFRGDITARVVVCNMDARMEDPKSRTFEWEPVAYTLAHREELVAAGLTILRAHAVAGFPGLEGLRPSRFPAWDKVVRAALVWCSEPDPQTTGEKIIAVNPERDQHLFLMNAWLNTIGPDQPLSAKDLIDRSMVTNEYEAGRYQWSTPWPEDDAPLLKTAITTAINAANGKPTPQLLGTYLAKMQGRIFDGMHIEVHEDKKNGHRYSLAKTDL